MMQVFVLTALPFQENLLRASKKEMLHEICLEAGTQWARENCTMIMQRKYGQVESI